MDCYAPEEYKKYADILETPQEIKARLAKHKKNKQDLTGIDEEYKIEWSKRDLLPYTIKFNRLNT